MSFNMVAKDSNEFTQELPTKTEDWYDFKSAFLTFANYKMFGKAITEDLPPIPDTNAAPFTSAWNSHEEAVRRRETQISTAWYFLNIIAGKRYKHVITRFGDVNPPNVKAAWEAIVECFENVAGSSQAQVLRTKLMNIKYTDTKDIDHDFGVIVEKIRGVKLALSAMVPPVILSDQELISNLHQKVPPALFTQKIAMIKIVNPGDQTFDDHVQMLTNATRSHSITRASKQYVKRR
jgi:hypothetical protein